MIQLDVMDIGNGLLVHNAGVIIHNIAAVISWLIQWIVYIFNYYNFIMVRVLCLVIIFLGPPFLCLYLYDQYKKKKMLNELKKKQAIKESLDRLIESSGRYANK